MTMCKSMPKKSLVRAHCTAYNNNNIVTDFVMNSRIIPRKSIILDTFGENGKACALFHGLCIISSTSFMQERSSFPKGHGLVAPHTLLESTISMLDSEDEKELFSNSGPCSSKHGLDDDVDPSPSPKRKKHYTTRSSGKQLPSWSKTINAQNLLCVLFGD